MQELTIVRPDDWHVHLRDQSVLTHTVAASAKHFGRALVMPNLVPALTTVADVLAYRARILSYLPAHSRFEPYMTLYLNTSIQETDLFLAMQHPHILGAKLYPAGATTNSLEGTHDITLLYPLFDAMQTYDLVLQVHGEVTFGDIFEREAQFIETHLKPIMANFPKLRIVFEHISTRAAVDFVMDSPATLAATITPQHLLYQRNDLLVGGIKPHYYCLPILKHQNDQAALRQAIASGHPRFFAGTDSAPHAKTHKENACGCAGIFSAPYALCFYAQVFDEMKVLPKLNDFTSRFGAEFYQLPIQTTHLTLIKKPQLIAQSLPFGSDTVIPLAAGTTLPWSIYEEN
ncbi:MAG TPA: dihydroorotase [Legionellaceae bacterium]|nr:dihydroorotase [Legionellaceae bacterium]